MITDGGFNALGDDHALGLALKLFRRDHLLNKMLQHHLGFNVDGLLVAFDIGAELFLRFQRVKQRIVLNGLLNFVVAAVRGVVGQHIEDKALFNGLFHRVQVEGREAAIGLLLAELLQRTVLRGGGEGEVRGIASHLAVLDSA
ncbi:hypothetical protein D3C81_1471150 [compost metagenome]